MVDFSTAFGQRVLERLKEETIIWLTTVDSSGRPQPRPVWFHWDGKTILILSQSVGAKVRHIRNNRKVALHFNTDDTGGDVAVLLGEAVLDDKPAAERLQAYGEKYHTGIQDLGMTKDEMIRDYETAITVTPVALRGFN